MVSILSILYWKIKDQRFFDLNFPSKLYRPQVGPSYITLTFGCSFVQVISELVKSSTITTINSTNCNDVECEKKHYSRTSTCGLIDQAGLSEFEKTNSSNKDESVDQQSYGVYVMDCHDNGDGLNEDSQSCKDTTEQYYDKDCSECQIIRRDPTPTELIMCLHAVSYKVSHWNTTGWCWSTQWQTLLYMDIEVSTNSNNMEIGTYSGGLAQIMVAS